MNLFAESAVHSCAGAGGGAGADYPRVSPLIAGNDAPPTHYVGPTLHPTQTLYCGWINYHTTEAHAFLQNSETNDVTIEIIKIIPGINRKIVLSFREKTAEPAQCSVFRQTKG